MLGFSVRWRRWDWKNLRKMKKPFFVFFALLWATLAHSQQFLWGVGFDTRFDNREYSGSRLATSQTLFSSRLSPAVGLGWGKGSSLIVGADLQLDFGAAEIFGTPPRVVMYYDYNSPKYKAAAGVFPRSKMAGDYSSAFFSDSVRFYDNNLEGFLLQYTGGAGYVELGLDWDGMYSKERRESFRIFSSGRGRLGSFYGGYAFSMYHLASCFDVHGVVDYMIFNPYVGFDFTDIVPVSKFSLQAGWMQSFQRDRVREDKFVFPYGGIIDIVLENWGFGISNSLYMGGDQMPYYNRYSSRLYTGNPFFRTTSGFYNRTELYWNISPRIKDLYGIDLHVGVILHYDGRVMASQQVAHLSVLLNRGLFASRK